MTETKKVTVKPIATEKPVTLNDKLAVIQQKLKSPKDKYNEFAKFNYRTCEKILEAVKPLLGNLTLILRDDIEAVSERYYVRVVATLSDGVDKIESEAFAREAETKTGMDVAQITGAASSYARKYALNGLFAIDDTDDPDTKDNQTATNAQPKTTKTPTPIKTASPTTSSITTPKTTEPSRGYPASPNQLAWVDKILKGRGERDKVSDEKLKTLQSKVASDFIGGKITSEQLFEILGIPYPKDDLGLNLDEGKGDEKSK